MLNSSLQIASIAGEHPRQVLGQAAGHHGGDGDLLDGDVDEVRRHRGDDVLGVAARALEHPQHALLGRRDDGQAVGPAAREHRLELVLQLGQLDAARVQPAALEAHAQPVDEVGIDAQRAAPRAHHGQLGAEVGDAGDPLPLVPRPADGALDLDAVDDAHQRRHRLDLVVPAERQVTVVVGGHAGREPRVVLREHGDAVPRDAGSSASSGATIRQHSHSSFTTTTSPSGNVDPAACSSSDAVMSGP